MKKNNNYHERIVLSISSMMQHAMKYSAVLLLCLLINNGLMAQSKPATFTLKLEKVDFEQVIKKVQDKSKFTFLYNHEEISKLGKVSVNVESGSIEDVLTQALANTKLGFKIQGDIIIISPKVDAPQLPVEIKGTITDKEGYGLLGATILEVGTTNGVTANEDGEFTLKVKNVNAVIRVSFVGFETQHILVGEKTDFKIVLESSASDLSEVVITGYQVIAKEKVTGAVVTIQEEELGKISTLNIMDNVEGKIPGLVNYRGVTSIRGVSTMNAEADPLIVLDGLPIEGDIEDVNPYDVESITVLKDAAAAAIYGVRASNGVIVITTKRAKEKGKITIEFSTDVTIKEKADYSYYNYMSPSQQVDWESDYYSWYFDGGDGTIEDPIGSTESNIVGGYSISPIRYDYYQLAKGDISATELNARLEAYKQNNFPEEYKKHALQNQVIQQYNLAIRTNNEKSQTNLVINYKTDNSGIIKAYDRQFNIFLKGKYSVTKWLDASYGINIIAGKTRTHNSLFATSPFNVPSYYSLFNDDGSRSYYRTSQFNAYNTITETSSELYSLEFNHLDELERDFVNTSTLNTRYFLDLNFKVLSGLTFNSMFQYEDNRTDVSAYSEVESYTMRWLYDICTERSGSEGNYVYSNLLPEGGRLGTSQTKSPNYTIRAQANYNKEFGKHVIDFLAGSEFRETRSYGTTGVLFGYDEQLQSHLTTTLDYEAIRNIGNTIVTSYLPTYYEYYEYIDQIGLVIDTKHRYASAYANATYTYDQKYNLFGSIRKDYADLFGGDKKYRGRPLWSVGASWVASNEDFMKNFKFLNYLKIRASYGLTGNIDANTTAVLTATTGMNYNTYMVNANITNPPNPQLRWEKTGTTNIGLDFALFDSRLRGSFDWYHRKGTDLFANKRIDPSEGYTNLVINNASMLNKGIEISLNYDWVRPAERDGFAWSSSIVLSHNKNEITYVDEITTNPQDLVEGNGFKKGYPVRALYSYQYAGLNETGQPLYYKADGTPSDALFDNNDIDAIIFSGGTDPKLNISLTNDFRYKGFSLSIFAVYYGGHYARLRESPTPLNAPSYGPLPSYLLDSWTPENTDTDIPASGKYYQSTLTTKQLNYSDFLVKSADFIKIRNIVLGYELPASIANKMKVSGIKLRFQINNPGTLWKKAKDVHIDPETSGVPSSTSYVLGLNVNF